MEEQKITKCHGVKATVFDLEKLTFDVVFQAAYFAGWQSVVATLVAKAKDDTLKNEQVFWHLLLEVQGGGRLWTVCSYEDVLGVSGLASKEGSGKVPVIL